MTTAHDELRALVLRARRHTRGRYPAELREQLIDYARQRWAAGASNRLVAEELGVNGHTLSYWRAIVGKKAALKVRAVEIITRTPTVRPIWAHGPRGLHMELTLDELAELMSKLG
jgi:FixJ family two-component response regulator